MIGKIFVKHMIHVRQQIVITNFTDTFSLWFISLKSGEVLLKARSICCFYETLF